MPRADSLRRRPFRVQARLVLPLRVQALACLSVNQMYLWRQLTTEQREEALRQRKSRKLPWHSPPHIDFEGPVTFIITAACYEHADIAGRSPDRLAEFEEEILKACSGVDAYVNSWCILPNHYHLLVRTDEIKILRKEIGKVHGRTSFRWNREDSQPGRKVWFNFFDRDMRSQRHFWASMNYIHNNAVHHGYVDRLARLAFLKRTPIPGTGRRRAGTSNLARIPGA